MLSNHRVRQLIEEWDADDRAKVFEYLSLEVSENDRIRVIARAYGLKHLDHFCDRMREYLEEK